MAVNAFFNPTINDPIVSSMELMHMPEVYQTLVKRFPKQRELDFLKAMGRHIAVSQTEWNWHEENKLIDSVLIAGKSNTGTADVIITLDSSNHTNSGTKSYPRIYDRVEFINGAQGLIIAKDPANANAHTITIRPISADHDVRLAAVVGDQLGMFSTAHAEGGTGYKEILVPTTTKFSNQAQIFRDYMSVTSTEQGNKTWVKFEFPEGHPKAGQEGHFLYIKGEADMIDRFYMKRELGIFTNDISDASLVDAEGNAIRTTRGFIPHIKRYGELADYVNQPGMDTLDTMVRLANKNYSFPQFVVMHGINFGLGLKNFGLDLMKNGAVVYNSTTGGAMKSVDLGFSTYTLNGYEFNFKALQALNHSDTTGLPGMSYSDVAIVCPLGTVKNPKTKEEDPSFCVRYKKAEGKGARDWYKIWEIGGNSDNGTDARLIRELHIESEEGAELHGVKQFQYFSKKSA
jgi:hypothetical protein